MVHDTHLRVLRNAIGIFQIISLALWNHSSWQPVQMTHGSYDSMLIWKKLISPNSNDFTAIKMHMLMNLKTLSDISKLVPLSFFVNRNSNHIKKQGILWDRWCIFSI